MNDDTQIWIMTTQLVVEDSPSYRPGCVTNGRVWQPHGITVIKLTGDAARSQSSSSLPGRPIRNWGLLCITLWWEQCACRFGHLDSDSWRELGISSPKLKKKKKPLEKKKNYFLWIILYVRSLSGPKLPCILNSNESLTNRLVGSQQTGTNIRN